MAKKLPVWNVYYKGWSDPRVHTVNVFTFGQFDSIFKSLKKILRKLRKETKDLSGREADRARERIRKALSDELHGDLVYYFWSKCEYEIIMSEWPEHYDCDRAGEKAAEFASQDPEWYKDHDKVSRVLYAADTGHDVKVDIFSQIDANYEHFLRVVFEYIGFEG